MKRDERKNAAVETLLGGEDWSNSRYTFEVSRPKIRVRDNVRGTLVAYSEANADFQDAILEFVGDYG